MESNPHPSMFVCCLIWGSSTLAIMHLHILLFLKLMLPYPYMFLSLAGCRDEGLWNTATCLVGGRSWFQHISSGMHNAHTWEWQLSTAQQCSGQTISKKVIQSRCGRVMADDIAYAKFRKSLLIWWRIQSGFAIFAIRTMCRASEARSYKWS